VPGPAAGLLQFDRPRPGSNAWAVAGSRTADGQAILANDMHLGLAVPNIWYRYALQFEEQTVAGVGLPGTPLLVAGTSRHLAWGLTALGVDVLDLVALDTDPHDPERYRVPDGWRRFAHRKETVAVKDGAAREILVRESLWGPVSGQRLLGRPVGYRWTALDPGAVDLALLDMDRTRTLSDGIALVNRAGGPPLNVVLADDGGRVAWTVMGRLPVRRGFDGAASRSWAADGIGWERYLDGPELPRTVDPAAGFVVSANDRAYREDYPYRIGHGFDTGYRAFRIKELLGGGGAYDAARMLEFQLDSRAGHYEGYRALALSAVRATPRDAPLRRALESQLQGWDGRAELGSAGLGLLVEFRKRLLDAVLAPLLAPCRERDAGFDFAWPHVDAPLQRLLAERPAGILPGVESAADWDRFLYVRLQESAEALQRRYRAASLAELSWGRINQMQVGHPFSAGAPLLAPLLDMPAGPQAGCEFCVRFALEENGATERLVVSPGRTAAGILHMPGGQSGQPHSPHYRDQHAYWSAGRPLPLLAERPRHRLRLVGSGPDSPPAP
jgi:penicillin amidase